MSTIALPSTSRELISALKKPLCPFPSLVLSVAFESEFPGIDSPRRTAGPRKEKEEKGTRRGQSGSGSSWRENRDSLILAWFFLGLVPWRLLRCKG
jgi:hypothetical protein